jgi:hypothetical protein
MRKHMIVKLRSNFIIFKKLEESLFTKISLSSRKIYFLQKSNLIFVGIFDTHTKGSLMKLCLLHVHTAFVNFIGENIEYINKNKKREEIGTVSQFGTDVGSNNVSKDFLQIKIFEVNLKFRII